MNCLVYISNYGKNAVIHSFTDKKGLDKMLLKQWLESIGCYDVKPCKVTLGRSVYEYACEYKQDRKYGENPYTIQAIYVVGIIHRPNRHMHYNNHDNFPFWYLAAYYQKGKLTDFQLYAYNFLLMPWNTSGSCGNKGTMVNMKIEYL